MNTIEKMISMVDFDSFFETVKVTSELQEKKISKDVVHQYLLDWAKAKKDLFKIFGERLTIEVPIDMTVEETVMEEFIDDLVKQYPMYAAQIKEFSVDDYMANCVQDIDRFSSTKQFFPTIYKKGAKVSKVLSGILHDEQFDIDLSKCLQNRRANGRCVISIHPMDYVTISTNNHNWASCMHIVDGFNKFGGYSLMLDSVTVVAYHDTGTMVEYGNEFGSFSWNNKISRQLVFVDIKNGVISFGHYNGTVSDNVRGKWRDMLFPLVFEEKKYENIGGRYALKNGEFYYDSIIYEAYVKNTKKYCIPYIGVRNMKCVICGKSFTNLVGHRGWLTCNEH